MQNNFSMSVAFTLRPDDDGQPYHCTSGDNGGETAYGITRSTLSRWLRRAASVEDVKALTPDTVRPIYQAFFWNAVCGDDLPIGVDLMLFDHAVLAGDHEAGIELQAELGMPDFQQDGHVGPITIGILAGRDPQHLIPALRTRQEAHYRSCSTFSLFSNGWLARLDRRVKAAQTMQELAKYVS